METTAFITTDSFARLANTTAYAAGDAVSDNATTGTALEFTNAAHFQGRGGVLETLTIKTDFVTAAGDPGGLAGELWLFTVAPVGTNFEDNAAVAFTYAESQNVVAVLPFDFDTDGYAGAAATAFVLFQRDLSIPYKCASTDTSLYGVIVARNAYVPASAQNIEVSLGVQRETSP